MKINIQHLSDIVSIGITYSKETAKEIKQLVDDVRYISYQTSCHDARIDDNEMNLKEIMGKIDLIQEDLHLLVQMNQGSRAQENPGEVVQKNGGGICHPACGATRKTEMNSL